MAPPSMDQANSLLTGLRVVEIGARTAAGVCGQLFAMLGATVFLYEPDDANVRHKWHNRARFSIDKQIVRGNLCAPGDNSHCATLSTLLAEADVLILSSDIDGIDLALWRRDAPHHQIVCDITAFGHTGPLAGKPYPEPLVQALTGHAFTTGAINGPPVTTTASLLDMQTAVYAAAAILAALHARDGGSAGQKIDMAMFDVGVNAILTFMPLHFTGRTPGRYGNRHPTLVPWNSYRTLDGWVLICAPTDDQWGRLCIMMGMLAAVTDARFATPGARLQYVEEINITIEGWTSKRSIDECLKRLSAAMIPSGSVVDIGNIVNDPNLGHRGMIRQMQMQPTETHLVAVPASPIRMRPHAHDGCILKANVLTPNAANGADAASAYEPALLGLRVVEIGTNTVGPLAARQLGALGADVVKVEPPGGDPARANAPFRDDGQSYAFALSNTDKLGIVLDFREKGDLDRLRKMLAQTDVLIENLKPGSLAKFGLSPAEIEACFPHLIYCSISGFGHDTVYPGRPALDSVIQGESGIMSVVDPAGVPMKTGVSTSDLLGGQFGLLAVLAAERYRRRTGVGMWLDIAMQDCSAWATQTLWNNPLRSTLSTTRIETADGWIVVDGAHSAFSTTALRTLSRDAAISRVVQESGRMAAPVLSIAEVLSHPQTTARGLLTDVPAADGTYWTVLQSPLRLLSTPATVKRAMPPLGASDPALVKRLLRTWPATKNLQKPTR